ncbi:hypothetical protein HPB50_022453 [Hyalomma asiaticum]|uniref:Uncharacterized protein n=1 Tax=Hyalomma asiaticum TaxID=266040 RepID=A0ACB7TMI8_HYAAI|nr:hypothetical protein HPB50_022453 [Hyalomma asiaticum]
MRRYILCSFPRWPHTPACASQPSLEIAFALFLTARPPGTWSCLHADATERSAFETSLRCCRNTWLQTRAPRGLVGGACDVVIKSIRYVSSSAGAFFWVTDATGPADPAACVPRSSYVRPIATALPAVKLS